MFQSRLCLSVSKELELVARLKVNPPMTKRVEHLKDLTQKIIPLEMSQMLDKTKLDEHIASSVFLPGRAISELEKCLRQNKRALRRAEAGELDLDRKPKVRLEPLSANTLLRGRKEKVAIQLDKQSMEKTAINQKLLDQIVKELQLLASDGSLSSQLNLDFWEIKNVKMSPSGKKILIYYTITSDGLKRTSLSKLHDAWIYYSKPLHKILRLRLNKVTIPKLLFIYDDTDARTREIDDILQKIEGRHGFIESLRLGPETKV